MMRRLQRVGVSVAVLSLVAVACGQGATGEPSTVSTRTTVSTDSSVTVSSGTSSVPTTPASTSSTTGETTATTEAAVVCHDIETVLPSHFIGIGILTFVTDGLLYGYSNGVLQCIIELPERLVDLPFRWRPAGDQLLFADGTILGSNGIVREPDPTTAASFWTRPTGTSTIRTTESGLVKTLADSAITSLVAPLTRHDVVAYHPDGTTFAVAGTDGVDEGIFVAANDGTDVRSLAFSDFGVRITEMTFTNDARWLLFVADHSEDDFDNGYHLHSTLVEPFDLDGVMTVGAIGESGAHTHFISEVPLDTISYAPGGSGSSDVPDAITVAQGACGPDRRALFFADYNDREEPVVLSDGPSTPLGIEGIVLLDGDLAAQVFVGSSADGCTGPMDLSLVTVNLTTFETTEVAIGVTSNAAVWAIPPAVGFTLSGAVIEPFA